MEENMALTSSFIPSSDLVKIDLRVSAKNCYYKKSDRSFDYVFGNSRYQD